MRTVSLVVAVLLTMVGLHAKAESGENLPNPPKPVVNTLNLSIANCLSETKTALVAVFCLSCALPLSAYPTLHQNLFGDLISAATLALRVIKD